MSLSGCWDRREPKNLAVVLSTIYDLKNTGNYETTLEVLKPGESSEKSGGAQNKTVLVSSEGISIPESVKMESVSMGKSIFGGHNYVRFLTERFAKDNVAPLMSYILRDYSLSMTPKLFVIKGENPSELYSANLGISDTLGEFFESISKSQPKVVSRSVFISTLEFIKDYYDDGKEAVVGLVELVEDKSSKGSEEKKSYKLKVEGLAAFKNEKLVGYLNGDETINYNILTNNNNTAVISIQSNDNEDVANMEKAKTSVKIYDKDGKITIDVNVKAKLNIIQEAGFADLTKLEVIKDIENKYNKKLKEELSATVSKVQKELKSDIFGFGRSFHIQYPKKWKEIKDKWNDIFADATVNISVSTSIKRTGQIKQPFRIEELA